MTKFTAENFYVKYLLHYKPTKTNVYNKLFSFCVSFVLACIFTFHASAKSKNRILVFFKTTGFYHTSIPAGIRAIQQLGKENKIEIDTTANANFFTKKNLKKYKAIVFLSTTGDVLNAKQQAVFMNYIHAGHGFVGIHSATSTERDWPWYNQLVGAYLDWHPEVQKATINVIDATHQATSFLPARWERVDEWYNFKNISTHIHVLLTLDESSYKGGINGRNHPFAWYHNFEGGRAFYTAGGHLDENFLEPLFLQHLLGGIQFAIKK